MAMIYIIIAYVVSKPAFADMPDSVPAKEELLAEFYDGQLYENPYTDNPMYITAHEFYCTGTCVEEFTPRHGDKIKGVCMDLCTLVGIRADEALEVSHARK